MSMPPFVRDPVGVVHKLVPYHQPSRGWTTYCDEDVRFSLKWRTLFPAEGRVTCFGCLGMTHP
jgi:hypothetical protein